MSIYIERLLEAKRKKIQENAALVGAVRPLLQGLGAAIGSDLTSKKSKKLKKLPIKTFLGKEEEEEETDQVSEARAASRELRSTKGSEHSPITGKETRFVPTAKQEAGLSDKAKRKLDSHRRRLAARTQDVASDAEEQSKAFKSGSSMKESLQRSLSRLFFEAKRFKHPKTAKFLAYRQGKQTEKASKELERTTRTPDKFEKKVDKLMGKKKYNTQTPSEMWREIHGNAKKGVEEYKGKRDAQERADAEREKRES